MLEHGGRLRAAAREFSIPLSDWLDLSTGISPFPYPVPAVPAAAWQCLPEDTDGLEAAAASYYGNAECLAVAGSQAAIQALPQLIPGEHVTVLAPMYAEHAHAWRKHRLRLCNAEPAADCANTITASLAQTDILIVINPCNPTGIRFEPEQLLDWHEQLLEHNSWLIVDEAFIDTTPEKSLVPIGARPNLIVLRSLGKFFGLAGARVGFVFAMDGLRHALAQQLGPWPISGPSRHGAQAALSDLPWQQQNRPLLLSSGQRLAKLLRQYGFEPHGPALFQWIQTPSAAALYQGLAEQGILCRRFDEPPSLRFGLPANEPAWKRLEAALRRCV